MAQRFVSPRRNEMSEEQQAIYDRFVTGPRAASGTAFSLVDSTGRLMGPPAAWVLSPPVGRALDQLGYAMRFELTLSPRAREMVILMVANRRASPFELYAHRRAGRAAGLTESDLQALEDNAAPTLTGPDDEAVYRFTNLLLEDVEPDEAEYRDAVGVLTERGVLELVMLVGYYQMVATQLAVFGLQPPSEDGAST